MAELAPEVELPTKRLSVTSKVVASSRNMPTPALPVLPSKVQRVTVRDPPAASIPAPVEPSLLENRTSWTVRLPAEPIARGQSRMVRPATTAVTPAPK